MQYQFRVIDQQDAYQGFFKIKRYHVDFELFRGGFSGAVMRECSSASSYVVVALPYDPVRQEFVLVEQFRIGAMVAGAHAWHQEVVAGFMDKPGETPEECMQRELQEEIGVQATKLERVDTYFGSPGGSAGQTHLFFAEVDAQNVGKHTGLLEEGEDILVHRVPYEEVFRQLFHGEITNSTMMLAVQAFLLRKQCGQLFEQYQPK